MHGRKDSDKEIRPAAVNVNCLLLREGGTCFTMEQEGEDKDEDEEEKEEEEEEEEEIEEVEVEVEVEDD
jgi:hypothetical protein